MRSLFLILLALFVVKFNLTAQTNLSGKLSNYKTDYSLTIRLSNSTVKLDSTIAVTSDGTFAINLQELVHEPSFVMFSLSDKNNILLSLNLFLAPNYALTLNANIKEGDWDETKNSVVLEGKGKHLSQLYLKKYYPIDTTKWVEKDIKTYVDYLNNIDWKPTERRIDSLLNEDPSDPYNQKWRSIFALNKKYMNLNNFIGRYCALNNVPFEKCEVYFKDLGFSDFWTEVNQPENLTSWSYKFFIDRISGYESEGLFRFPSNLYQKYKNHQFYNFSIINELFSGEVRDYVLESQIRRGVVAARTVEVVDSLQSFIPWVNNPRSQKDLQKLTEQRRGELSEINPGNSISKTIKFKNTITNDTLTLADLKGKMVFLEAWASWCGPCRAEIPHLKKLVAHYKDNPNVAFISVAVRDYKEAEVKLRMQVIKDEKMDWMQLEDISDNFFDYFKMGEKGIPHNVILDKEGVIVDNDSIRPSDPGIIAYIDKLLSQQ